MRITISCPDVQSYLDNPESFLPDKPVCLNNPDHRPYWNTRWERGLHLDHVHTTEIPLFNAYCEECHETISYWPEFVLPYQREPLETHEQVVIEHLQGISISESAARIGYDPRTVSRWIKLTLTQALALVGQVVRRILSLIGTEILPLTPAVASRSHKAPACLVTRACRIDRLSSPAPADGPLQPDWQGRLGPVGRPSGESQIPGKRSVCTRIILPLKGRFPTNQGSRQTS